VVSRADGWKDLRALKDLDQGIDLPGSGMSFYDVRAIERFVPGDTTWRDMQKDFLESLAVSANGQDADTAPV
jgi:hypothetical protein